MKATLGLLAVLFGALFGGGCATPVGVDRISTQKAHAELTASVISSGKPSASTRRVLYRLGLFEEFERDPVATLASMHEALAPSGDEDRVFALAELSFLHGTQSGEREYFLASAIYAKAFLVPGELGRAPEGFDPRFRLACDLYNLGLVRGLSLPDSDEVSLEAGHFELPFGPLDLTSTVPEFRWGGYRLGRFQSTTDLRVRGLRNVYRHPGIGAPLAASILAAGSEEEAAPGAARIPPDLRVPVTALLRVENARRELVEGGLRGTLELYSEDDALRLMVGKADVPLEFETTSSLALSLEGAAVWDFELKGFRSGERWLRGRDSASDGLYMLQPYTPGRIPVVLVHGTASSPARWAEMINELDNDPRIWERYQIWLFIYNSGNPIAISGSDLREGLLATAAEFDPQQRDEAMSRMVVIGHSQGGLLAKLTAIASGDRFWRELSDVPLDELDLDEDTRELLQRALFFEPVPFVKSLIYIATPHRGSYLTAVMIAGFSPSNWLKGLIRLPGYLSDVASDIVLRNPDAKLRRKLDQTPTSIDNMTPGNLFLETLEAIPVAPGVTTHSIIAVRGDGPPEQGNDGVVKYSSAHIDGVASELVVRSAHSTQAEPDTIEEVRRILLEHANRD